MTFDLDPAASAVRDRVRGVAAALHDAAAAIDVSGVLPPDVAALVQAALPPAADRLGWALAVEEIAAVSGSLAAHVLASAGGGSAGTTTGFAGLRGVDVAALETGQGDDAGTVAAILIGLGRAALGLALAAMKSSAPESRPEQRYWMVSDAAAELDGARLLLWRAATRPSADATANAMARAQARIAAQACVDAARRVLGTSGAAAGSPLDRISRDVATAALVGGGPEHDERTVAAGVLPG